MPRIHSSRRFVSQLVTLSLLAGAVLIAPAGLGAASAAGAGSTTAWSEGSFHVDAEGVVSRSDVVLQRPMALTHESMPLGNGNLGAAVWSVPGVGMMAQLNRVDLFPNRKSAGEVVFDGLGELLDEDTYRGRLDLYNGQLVQSAGDMQVVSYVRSGSDQLVVEVTGADPDVMQNVDLKLWSAAAGAVERLPKTYAANGVAALAETWSDDESIADAQQFSGAPASAKFGSLIAATAVGRDLNASVVDSKTVRISFKPRTDGSFRVVVGAPQYTNAPDDPEAGTIDAAVAEASSSALSASDLAAPHRDWWNDFWETASPLKITSSDGSGEYVEAQVALSKYTMAAMARGPKPATHGGVAHLFSAFRDTHPWNAPAYWHYNQRMGTMANYPSNMTSFNEPYFTLYTDSYERLRAQTTAVVAGDMPTRAAGAAAVPGTRLLDWTPTYGTTVPDSSGRGRSGNVVGSATPSYISPDAAGTARGKSGLVLDGSTYVTLPNPALPELTALTVDMQVRVDSVAGYRRLVDFIPAGGNGSTGFLVDLDPSNRIRFIGAGLYRQTTVALPQSQWTNVSLTLTNAGVLTVYIDGQQQWQEETNVAVSIPENDALALRFGADQNGNSRLHGAVSRVRIYSESLSAAQVASIATTGWRGLCVPEMTRYDAKNTTWGQPACDITQPNAANYTTHILSTGPEIAFNMINQAAYTGEDLEPLYPWIADVTRFYLSRLDAPGTDGIRHLTKANAFEDVWLGTDPAPDVAAMRVLFPLVEALATDVGDTVLASQLDATFAQLPPLPTGGTPSLLIRTKDGSGAFKTPIQTPQLEAVFPWGLIGQASSAGQLQLGRDTFAARPGQGYDWRLDAAWAARLGLAADVKFALLDGIEKFQVYPNGMASFNGAIGGTYAKAYYDEWLHVVRTGVQEALVQDHDGVVHVASAWPASWDVDAELQIRGGHDVSVQTRGGVPTLVGINADSTQQVTVANPWPGQQIEVVEGEFPHTTVVAPTNAAEIAIDVEDGESYVIQRTAMRVNDGTFTFEQVTGAQTDDIKLLGSRSIGLRSTLTQSLSTGKSAQQSSTYQGAGADRAVDGDFDGEYGHGSVSHTLNTGATPNWWKVDLGASHSLTHVDLYPRTACCPERLSNYYVFVSDAPFDTSLTPVQQTNAPGVWHSFQSGPAAQPTRVQLPAGSTGRYVMVQLATQDYLSIAEVNVFGE
ncbi:LamG-like jellyroll fold domain-containing protein [Microbacterium sulfonylureivorans]|uniref:LamG-like jellyroll fold domain-containing protein n=1 Tax=Microbacterium sulfonylureivorans TaxID=2486854 RepID=UPI000FD7A1EC|nr:LamG-like jellyroll fold domain-containing protein [Microbacterium sulfonylureivorans]